MIIKVRMTAVRSRTADKRQVVSYMPLSTTPSQRRTNVLFEYNFIAGLILSLVTRRLSSISHMCGVAREMKVSDSGGSRLSSFFLRFSVVAVLGQRTAICSTQWLVWPYGTVSRKLYVYMRARTVRREVRHDIYTVSVPAEQTYPILVVNP
ncbi:hypothetical protein BKA93DRAFT_584854 [Sparassis latifolia]